MNIREEAKKILSTLEEQAYDVCHAQEHGSFEEMEMAREELKTGRELALDKIESLFTTLLTEKKEEIVELIFNQYENKSHNNQDWREYMKEFWRKKIKSVLHPTNQKETT